MTDSPARRARETAGLTVGEAARRARVSEDYLLRAERRGCSLVLAERLSALYGCSLSLFTPKPTKQRRAAGCSGKRGATNARPTRRKAGTPEQGETSVARG